MRYHSPSTWPVLLVMVLFAWGCSNSHVDDPPEPEAKASTRAATPGVDVNSWLDDSPLEAHMRSMWIDCANIVHFANDPELAHLDSIECAGEDLARKAGRYGAFWQGVETSAQAVSEAARGGEWDAARRHYRRIWKACCDCHVEAWPLRLRSYTAEILDRWVTTGDVAGTAKWSSVYADRLEARPRSPFHERMHRLNDQAYRIASGLDSRQSVTIAESCTMMTNLVEQLSEPWWAIHDCGKAIQEAAENGKHRVLKPLYRELREACVNCHAMSIIGNRRLLNPPEWR